MNSGRMEVVSVNGTSVTLSPPLYNGDTNGPMAYRFTAGAHAAGREALKLRANNTGYTTNILISGSAGCWATNIESDFADGDHMRIYWGLRNEVLDNFFHDGFDHGPVGTDNSLVIAHKSSANLVQNNVFYRQQVSVMLEAAGKVIPYY